MKVNEGGEREMSGRAVATATASKMYILYIKIKNMGFR